LEVLQKRENPFFLGGQTPAPKNNPPKVKYLDCSTYEVENHNVRSGLWTIVWTKFWGSLEEGKFHIFGGNPPLPAPQKWPSQSEIFGLFNIES